MRALPARTLTFFAALLAIGGCGDSRSDFFQGSLPSSGGSAGTPGAGAPGGSGRGGGAGTGSGGSPEAGRSSGAGGTTGGSAGGPTAGAGAGTGNGGTGNGGTGNGGTGNGGTGNGGTGNGGSGAAGGSDASSGGEAGGEPTAGAPTAGGSAGSGGLAGNGASGGDGPGGGGAGADGGTTGDDCDSVLEALPGALAEAQACSLATSDRPCQGSVTDQCGCDQPVNDPSSAAARRYATLAEYAARRCGIFCPAILCREPRAAMCVTDGALARGRCEAPPISPTGPGGR